MRYFISKLLIIISFIYSLKIQGQNNNDCNIYDKALVRIDSLFSSVTSQKYYFYIEENTRKITKDLLKTSKLKIVQDSILKLGTLTFSDLDIISCSWNKDLKTEVCESSSDKPYLFDMPSYIYIGSVVYFPMGITFYQVVYLDNHAILAVIVRYNLQATAAYQFLFEKKEDNWIIKEVEVEVN